MTSGNYEFSGEQNKTIKDLAFYMKFLGIVLVITGGLYAIYGLAGTIVKGPASLVIIISGGMLTLFTHD